MHILRFGLALICLGLATTAKAQGTNPRNPEMQGTVRPAPENYPGYLEMISGAFRAWKGDQDKRLTSYSYRTVLRFAECVAQFDRTAAPRVLRSRLDSVQSENELMRMASTKRPCVVEHSKVHPLLLRAALAETRLKAAMDNANVSLGGQSPVGVPAVVDGYRLGQIAHCQTRSDPQLVRQLLATQPESRAERQAAEALFAKTGEWGALRLGRLTATAARPAVIDAEYTRRFIPGSASR